MTNPTPLVYENAAALAAAYDNAVALLTDYERRYGEGNFHVVLGDGNIDRGFVAADYHDLMAATQNSDRDNFYRIYPDPEGLAWMKAILELPVYAYEGAIVHGCYSPVKTRPGLSIITVYDESESDFYCFDVLCPRCGTHRDFSEPIDMHKHTEPVYCESAVCQGQAPFALMELYLDDFPELKQISDYSNLMGLASS